MLFSKVMLFKNTEDFIGTSRSRENIAVVTRRRMWIKASEAVLAVLK